MKRLFTLLLSVMLFTSLLFGFSNDVVFAKVKSKKTTTYDWRKDIVKYKPVIYDIDFDNYEDIPGVEKDHPNYEAIVFMHKNGALPMTNGRFEPDKPATNDDLFRADFNFSGKYKQRSNDLIYEFYDSYDDWLEKRDFNPKKKNFRMLMHYINSTWSYGLFELMNVHHRADGSYAIYGYKYNPKAKVTGFTLLGIGAIKATTYVNRPNRYYEDRARDIGVVSGAFSKIATYASDYKRVKTLSDKYKQEYIDFAFFAHDTSQMGVLYLQAINNIPDDFNRKDLIDFCKKKYTKGSLMQYLYDEALVYKTEKLDIRKRK